MAENDKLKIAIERQAKQIAKLKAEKRAGKKPFYRSEKHLGIALAVLVLIINMTFDFGLSEWELMVYMIPLLLFAYLGENKNG